MDMCLSVGVCVCVCVHATRIGMFDNYLPDER